MLELPNAQRRQQQSFRAGERARGGHRRRRIGPCARSALAIVATAARTFVSLSFFDPTRRFAYRQMPAAIHKVPHIPSSFQTNDGSERTTTATGGASHFRDVS